MNELLVITSTSAAAGGCAVALAKPFFNDVKLGERAITRKLHGEMTAAGMDASPLACWLFWGTMASVGLGAFFFLAGMIPVMIVAAGLPMLATPAIIRFRIAAFRRQMNLQVAGVSRSLAGQVRVGLPLTQALATVAHETPAPFGKHLKNMVRSIDQGETVREALAALKTWVKVESVTALSIALQVADERGGKLSDVLDRIAHTADEIARCERKRESNVASGRLMVAIMSVFPFGFLGFVYLMDESLAKPLFNTFPGQLVLAAVIVLMYLSARWASKILAPKV